MHPFFFGTLCVFAFLLPVVTSLNTPSQFSQPQRGNVMHPINLVDFETSMALQRRDSSDLSVLDPQSQSELIYGSLSDNDQLLLANMTLYAQPGLPIVLLERFEELNISVKCWDDEGQLLLTFGSMDAFEYALKQWGYVNEADNGSFLFIANKDECGPDDQRQAYIVSNITDDTTMLTTSLAAKPVAWSDVAGSYELAFGHAVPVSQTRRLKRGFLSDIDTVANKVQSATKGDYNKTKSASLRLDAGHQNQRVNIFTDHKTGSTIDCTSCFIAGSLDFTGYLLVHDFELQDFTITASPNSVFAALELEAIITASFGPDSLAHTTVFPKIPIPDVGFTLPKFIDLGPSLVYSVGVNLSFSGSTTVDFGVNTTVPDSAQILVDYSNRGASKATGFGESKMVPSYNINNESVSVTLSAFSQPAIDFGVNLYELGNLDVNVAIMLPEVSTTVGAKYDEDGVCSHDKGASKTGLQFDSDASIVVDLGAELKVGEKDEGSWSTQVFSTSKPLPSKCYQLNVSGLVSSPNTTAGPSLPVTLPISATSSAGSAFPNASLEVGPATNNSSISGPNPNLSSNGSIPTFGNLSEVGTTSNMPSKSSPLNPTISIGGSGPGWGFNSLSVPPLPTDIITPGTQASCSNRYPVTSTSSSKCQSLLGAANTTLNQSIVTELFVIEDCVLWMQYTVCTGGVGSLLRAAENLSSGNASDPSISNSTTTATATPLFSPEPRPSNKTTSLPVSGSPLFSVVNNTLPEPAPSNTTTSWPVSGSPLFSVVNTTLPEPAPSNTTTSRPVSGSPLFAVINTTNSIAPYPNTTTTSTPLFSPAETLLQLAVRVTAR